MRTLNILAALACMWASISLLMLGTFLGMLWAAFFTAGAAQFWFDFKRGPISFPCAK